VKTELCTPKLAEQKFVSFCVFYFYQNQEFISYFLCVSTCGVETVNFLSLYVRSEPVKFLVNQRRGCSPVTWLCQMVTAEEKLSVRQIICWKIMKLHWNFLHWQFLNRWVTVRFVQQHSVASTFVRSFFTLSLAAWLFICLFSSTAVYTYNIFTQSDLRLYTQLYIVKAFFYAHWWLQNVVDDVERLSAIHTSRVTVREYL